MKTPCSRPDRPKTADVLPIRQSFRKNSYICVSNNHKRERHGDYRQSGLRHGLQVPHGGQQGSQDSPLRTPAERGGRGADAADGVHRLQQVPNLHVPPRLRSQNPGERREGKARKQLTNPPASNTRHKQNFPKTTVPLRRPKNSGGEPSSAKILLCPNHGAGQQSCYLTSATTNVASVLSSTDLCWLIPVSSAGTSYKLNVPVSFLSTVPVKSLLKPVHINLTGTED